MGEVILVSVLLIFLIGGFILTIRIRNVRFEKEREQRQEYYRNVYLKSEAWQRKRFVVLRRDNWRCVCCGAKATQVHHKRYARNIGSEPIKWLISVCDSCHESFH